MAALAAERETSRSDYRKQFLRLNPGKRQALADLQGDPNVAGDTDGPLQGAIVDDMDLDLLRQCTNGDKAFFEEIRETLQLFARYQCDEWTWKWCLTDLHKNWQLLITGMADAYLRWKYGCGVNAKPTTSQPPLPPPTADGTVNANTPLSVKSPDSNLNHTSVNNVLPNTILAIHTSTNNTATDDALATTCQDCQKFVE
ncbi:hypothetical protein BDM02DRAFT_3191481 [Thelephora ganbajun]|uniref:Uncharacterized protein n=1 Tax=Thelephora ganbajun TaxID=370292 RepID=A0ACB6Z259_THEGA|nr:hypothetical protein BDM02DRAFT_3191481 [Thelephora ganbajun]